MRTGLKVGNSLRKCIFDILDGAVSEQDVYVIVTGTNFEPHDDKEWGTVWLQYTLGPSKQKDNRMWGDFVDHEEDVRNLVLRLYDRGKIHQPRRFGARAPIFPHHWFDLVPTPDNENPAVTEAWNRYITLAGLCNEHEQ